MSDDVIGSISYTGIDIPARFIRQAAEHVEHTGSRHVTFLFTGQVESAVCIGITTQLRITDQRPRPPRMTETVETETPREVTRDSVLQMIRQNEKINMRSLGDQMGVPRSDTNTRSRIRKHVTALSEDRLIKKTDNTRYPSYAVTRKGSNNTKMSVRSQPPRSINRRDITEEAVLEAFAKTPRLSSKKIGDDLQIPRPDNLVRSKITEVVRGLIHAGRVRDTGEKEDGGRLYELVDEASAAAA